MAKKPPKNPMPKHDKLMRRMEIGDSAVKGRFQEAWEEIQRQSQDQKQTPAPRVRGS